MKWVRKVNCSFPTHQHFKRNTRGGTSNHALQIKASRDHPLPIFAMFLLDFLVGVVLLGVLILRRRSFATVAEIPGPLSASFSSAWQIWHIIKGDIDRCTTELHRELGKWTPKCDALVRS